MRDKYLVLMTTLLLVMALVGCSRVSAQSPTPMPVPVAAETPAAVGLRPTGDTVVASGEIVPAQEAQLAFTVSGRAQAVTVAEGDQVEAGQALVTLETDSLDADVAQAEAALDVAQAQQALLGAGPRPGEVATAEAEVEAAEARLAQAAARRDQITAGAADAEVTAAQAALAAAQAEEKSARIAYDQMQGRKVQDWEEEVTNLRLRAAELSRAAAKAQLAQAEQGTQIRVREARAAVWAAAAQGDVAQAQLDKLRAGTMPEEMAAARAAVAQAEAALGAARAALDQATLRAPFAGEVASLEMEPGETVVPGQVVLVLADLSCLQVETTDLSERDVALVAVGQRATVQVEALGVEIGGRVASIASQAEVIGGDVVYAVVVELDEQPPGLRWGMSAEVEIITG